MRRKERVSVKKYGLDFKDWYDDAQIERDMLRNGGYVIHGRVKYGLGLLQHFKNYWACLWPDDEQTWWTDLIMKEVLENRFTGIIGPSNSWKTSTCARMALMDWSLFPECTMVLMSSTTMGDLRNRVYGETSKFWMRAKEQHEWFPGYPIDHICVIANESIDEDEIRDLRNGIQGVPNKTSDGKVQGMSRFVGKKNLRVWCVCDEVQFCERSFLEAQNNLSSNGPNLVPGYRRDEQGNKILDSNGKAIPLQGYKGIFIGNPNPTRPENPLHMVCEPEGGFESLADDGKTKTWFAKRVPNNVVQARVINLDARDSPNNAYPDDKPRWVNLCSKKRLAEFQPESESYWTQGVGFVKLGFAGAKIITRQVCDQFHAFDGAVWKTSPTLKVGGLDAAYGGVGGDRCVTGYAEIGECVDGITRILFHPFRLVPVKILPETSPEDQIAQYCKTEMEANGVLPENFFFDGRGAMAISLGRIWSTRVNSLEFGGRATDRPAGPDLFIDDPTTKSRRPKLAHEHYSKFVSELWWAWRLAIESDQIRGLSFDVVLDASPREWYKSKGDKIDIETKKDMRLRTGCSPDLADWAAIIIDGARRRGFQIMKIGQQPIKKRGPDWLDEQAREYEKLLKERELTPA